MRIGLTERTAEEQSLLFPHLPSAGPTVKTERHCVPQRERMLEVDNRLSLSWEQEEIEISK